MSRTKKIILGLLTTVLVVVTGVCAYGIKMYSDANSALNRVHDNIDRTSTKRTQKVRIEDTEPFSVLLMGVDTGALGRTDQGRSDSMMVVTVNAKKGQSTIVSLDRDIYTEIVGHDTMDKLNHAYAFGGAKMAMDSVENLLDIPIDHYVAINMQGLRDLIDAVGGIQVDNKIDFTLEGVHVPAGKITLDGKTGLAYARMRKDDPEGDIGRQRRQREVVQKIVDKVIGLDGVTRYNEILKAVEKNTKTDLSWDDMMDIQAGYLPAFKKIESMQLEGEGSMMNGVYYQLLDANELLKTQNTLKEQLEIPTSDSLPTADEHTSGYSPEQFLPEGQSEDQDAYTDDATYSTYNEEAGYSEEADTGYYE